MTPAEAETILIANGFEPTRLSESRFFFLTAFKEGNLELAEAFIVCGMPFLADHDREPAIIKAAEGNSLPAINLALKLGARLETRDRAGDTALHTAANWKHAALVEALAKKGAQLDVENDKRFTPLGKAVVDERADMVAKLLALGADPNFGSVPPLTLSKSKETLALLLEAGANPNVHMSGPGRVTLLMDRVARGQAEDVSLLLRAGAKDEPNLAGWTALMLAKHSGKAAIAALLEKHGLQAGDGARPLHAATTIEAVQQAIKEGASLDAVDHLGSTALVTAARAKNRALALWLLEQGADPKRADSSGRSAVTFAAAANDLELLERLLERGAPANESTGPDGPRSLALGHCGANGHVEAVTRLIKAGANLESRDEHQQTAVFLAASKGKPAVLEVLLAAGANPAASARLSSALSVAVQNKQTACVKLLLAAGARADGHDFIGRALLMTACDAWKNTNVELGHIVRLLLNAGADPRVANSFGQLPLPSARSSQNQPGREAIESVLSTEFLNRFTSDGGERDWKAAAAAMHEEHLRALIMRGDQSSVRELMRAGMSPDLFSRGAQPVLFMCVADAPELFDLALDAGADPFGLRFGVTLLSEVAGNGTPAQLTRLLRAGLDPNARSKFGSVPLCSARDVEMARLLVAGGADVNAIRAGWTPLARAVQRGSLELVEYLLGLGADADVVMPPGKTALKVAQELKDKEASKAIAKRLARVTKVDTVDELGRTPLFHAAMRGDARSISTLLARKAKPAAKDKAGQTPLQVGALRANVAHALGVAWEPLKPARLPESPAQFETLRRGEPTESVTLGLRDARGETALHLAIRLGDLDRIEAFLEAGADVTLANTQGDTAWSLAMAFGVDVTDELKRRGAKIDLEQQVLTASRYDKFRAAMRAGDLREVEKQLVAGAVDVHLIRSGETPLFLAAQSDDPEMVSLLLAMGADVRVPTMYGSVANAALWQGKVELAAQLLDAGAPLDRFAVQHAADRGLTQVLRMLVERSAALEVDVVGISEAESLRKLIDFAIARGATALVERATAELNGRSLN